MKIPRRRRVAPEKGDASARRRRREDLFRPLASLCVVLFVVAVVQGYGLMYIAKDAQRTARRAERLTAKVGRNTEALRVGCIVLANTIIRAGAGGRRPDTVAGRAQAELTALVYTAVSRSLTPEERARMARLQGIVRRAGGVVEVPPCDDIAAHPERVKSLIPPPAPPVIPAHPNP